MNAPAGSQIGLVIVGATGMVGGYALRYALDHPSVGVVTVIGRKKLDISHSKLRQVLHRDFADCSALAQSLSGQDFIKHFYQDLLPCPLPSCRNANMLV